MSASELFDRYFDECPLVAIIRGVTSDIVEEIGRAIESAGIRIIEVPLNSPDAVTSIGLLGALFGERMLVGAGTVLDVGQVRRVADAEARLAVSPNTNTDVIRASVAAGMVSCPGYFTPSEAFAALDAGAHALKLFPAEGASPAVLKAQRAVIPPQVPILAVGGVTPQSMRDWLDAGADGFGLGSGLFKPGKSAADVAQSARDYVAGLEPR